MYRCTARLIIYTNQTRYAHAKDLLERAKRLEKEEKERKERESRENVETRGKEKADRKRRLKLAQEREVSFTPIARSVAICRRRCFAVRGGCKMQALGGFVGFM